MAKREPKQRATKRQYHPDEYARRMERVKRKSPGLRAVLARVEKMYPREINYYHKTAISVLADQLGISRQAVRYWWRVPDARIKEISKLTGLPEDVVME